MLQATFSAEHGVALWADDADDAHDAADAALRRAWPQLGAAPAVGLTVWLPAGSALAALEVPALAVDAVPAEEARGDEGDSVAVVF